MKQLAMKLKYICLAVLLFLFSRCEYRMQNRVENNSKDTLVSEYFVGRDSFLLPGRILESVTGRHKNPPCCACRNTGAVKSLKPKDSTKKLLKDLSDENNWEIDNRAYKKEKLKVCVFRITDEDIQ
jgi:hypothetical protein